MRNSQTLAPSRQAMEVQRRDILGQGIIGRYIDMEHYTMGAATVIIGGKISEFLQLLLFPDIRVISGVSTFLLPCSLYHFASRQILAFGSVCFFEEPAEKNT